MKYLYIWSTWAYLNVPAPPEMLNILSQYIYPISSFGIYPEWQNYLDNHICAYFEDIWTQEIQHFWWCNTVICFSEWDDGNIFAAHD